MLFGSIFEADAEMPKTPMLANLSSSDEMEPFHLADAYQHAWRVFNNPPRTIIDLTGDDEWTDLDSDDSCDNNDQDSDFEEPEADPFEEYSDVDME